MELHTINSEVGVLVLEARADVEVVSIYCFSGGEGFPSDPFEDAVLLSVV